MPSSVLANEAGMRNSSSCTSLVDAAGVVVTDVRGDLTHYPQRPLISTGKSAGAPKWLTNKAVEVLALECRAKAKTGYPPPILRVSSTLGSSERARLREKENEKERQRERTVERKISDRNEMSEDSG